MQWTKWANEPTSVSKVKVILWPSPDVSQFSKLNPFLSKTFELFETKYHVKDFGSTEIII